MPLTMDDMTDLILSKYENTDAAQAVDVTARRARVVHFEQRAVDKIWYDRTWPFSMSSASLTMSGGSAARPSDFAGITGEGGLWDSSGRPWMEISHQDMQVIRATGKEASRRLFNIGSTILVPDTGSTGTFTLVYQKTAPELSVYGSVQAVPLPYSFWETILLGAVSLLKFEKGDERVEWRGDFLEALAKQQRLWANQASRPKRMPITVGGMW